MPRRSYLSWPASMGSSGPAFSMVGATLTDLLATRRLGCDSGRQPVGYPRPAGLSFHAGLDSSSGPAFSLPEGRVFRDELSGNRRSLECGEDFLRPWWPWLSWRA